MRKLEIWVLIFWNFSNKYKVCLLTSWVAKHSNKKTWSKTESSMLPTVFKLVSHKFSDLEVQYDHHVFFVRLFVVCLSWGGRDLILDSIFSITLSRALYQEIIFHSCPGILPLLSNAHEIWCWKIYGKIPCLKMQFNKFLLL